MCSLFVMWRTFVRWKEYRAPAGPLQVPEVAIFSLPRAPSATRGSGAALLTLPGISLILTAVLSALLSEWRNWQTR